MAVVVCPWCQNEIPQEEGAEPERYCPVCENELGGYRTLTLDGEDEEDEEDAVRGLDDEDLDWLDDVDLPDNSEALLRFEESVEALLDEQEAAPGCPNCQEYMLEAGTQVVGADAFLPRNAEPLGGAVLGAPFSLTVYVCPSCFAVQHMLDEQGRVSLARRLSGAERG